MEIIGRYIVEIYCGRTYCGNALCDTYGACLDFFKNDPFCDKAIIKNLETGEKNIVRMNKEV